MLAGVLTGTTSPNSPTAAENKQKIQRRLVNSQLDQFQAAPVTTGGSNNTAGKSLTGNRTANAHNADLVMQ
jgi:hypothetical protein